MAEDSGSQPIGEELILSALDLMQLANREGRRELNDRLIDALRAKSSRLIRTNRTRSFCGRRNCPSPPEP